MSDVESIDRSSEKNFFIQLLMCIILKYVVISIAGKVTKKFDFLSFLVYCPFFAHNYELYTVNDDAL